MKKKTKLIGYIIGVIFFIATIAGFTYAMYRKTLLNVNIIGTANNLDSYIIYSKGTNISSGTLRPSTYTNGASTIVTFYQSSSSPYSLYGHIYLDINSISNPLIATNILKYKIVNNNTGNVVGEGNFYNQNDSVLAATNMSLRTTATTFTVYIWIEEEEYDSNLNITGSSFDIDIRCHATMKEME